jgi:long-chain fatty acid transport protein
MRTIVLGLSACLVLVPAAAEAQGFGIYEQGACVMSRGGAGVAEPCADGSAIYVNPAGVTGRDRVIVGGGGTLIFGTGSFTSDLGVATSIDSRLAVAPHGYFQLGITPRLGVGVGIYVPYGLSLKWPIDFPGRFLSYDSRLNTVYIQPTAAYAISDAISVGGGLTVAVGSVELHRREDLANVPLGAAPGLTFAALVDQQTDFANTVLSASRATGIGANLGVIMKVHDRVRIGARYLTHVKLDYNGTAVFTPVAGPYRVSKPNALGLPIGTPLDPFVAQVFATLQDQGVRTAIDMPAQLTVGLSVHASRRLSLWGDYQWIGWSAFDKVTLDFSQPIPPDEELVQNYRDTNAVRLGLAVQASPKLQLRAGYFHNQAAAPDENVTPLLPDATRNHITAGVGWSVHPRVTIDVAYQFVHHDDRRGRIVNPPPGEPPTTSLNSGVYRARGDLLGITLTYRR